MKRAAAVVLAVVALGGLAAFALTRGGDDADDREATSFRLDGSIRVPDDEGVVTEISHQRVTLDGKRTYRVSENLRSFSTYTLELEPMLNRDGHYVQVGLRGDVIVWMAGIAAVVPSNPPAVYYTGVLERIANGRLEMADGTVFRLGDAKPSVAKGSVTVRLDASTGRVAEVTARGGA